MFISNDFELYWTALGLIIGMSSATVIGCSFCCYRKCCSVEPRRRSDPYGEDNPDYIPNSIEREATGPAFNPYLRLQVQNFPNYPTAPPIELSGNSPPPTYNDSIQRQNKPFTYLS